jgi:flagellar protein FlgJ
MLSVHSADVYADFNGLANLKNQARKDSPEALKETARQFEAIFLSNVLKSMRDAKLADGITDNDQSKFYNELSHDQPDNEKLALDDYLNRSAGTQKGISKYPRAVGNRASNTVDGQVIINAYIHDSSPLNEMTEIPLKNNHARPIQSAEDFIRQLHPYAQQAAKELGVEPRVILAQAALETGWGRSLIKNSNGESSFNLFNIKADKSWHGKQAQVPALEFEQGIAKKVNAGFRSYGSFQESFQDYVAFIKNNPRYGDALKQAGNGERYLHELQRAGYATDPNYANKIMNIYHSNTMAEFEPETVVAMR